MEIENNTLENLVVSTLEDENDGDLSAGDLSLREAIANASPGASITFGDGLSGSIILGQGELIINKSLNIQGSGAKKLTIDGSNSTRSLVVDDGNADTLIDVSISDVTVANTNSGRDTGDLDAAGVLNRENLTISNSALTNNYSINNGAIQNEGQLQLQNSLVSGNNGGNAAIGNFDGAKATISNSTIADNNADGFGAISNFAGSELTIVNSTITGNDSGRAAIFADGDITAISSIIAGNTGRSFGGGDFYGDITSSGNNLVGISNSSFAFDPTDIAGTPAEPIDPLLGELQDNGGPTATVAPLAGSPALNAGSNPKNLATDQRGGEFSRTFDTGTDIGAFESQTIDPNPPEFPIEIVGTANNDFLTGNQLGNIIRGLAGDDTLEGLRSNDVLKGNRGNDSLEGGVGDDTLEGGVGDDFLNGGPGDNSLFGGAGNDRIFGGGNDIIRGAGGNDFIVGLGGDDDIIGGAGDDTIIDGSGNSRVTGRVGRDVFVLADQTTDHSCPHERRVNYVEIGVCKRIFWHYHLRLAKTPSAKGTENIS
ncbi:MAG: calcium-binding protein [Cyanobacteria bacterium J06600_6]